MMLRSLTELCVRNIELIDPKRTPDSEFWYIDISAVDNKLKRISSPQRASGKTASVRARQLVRKNDVLISTTRPNLNAVALVPKNYDGEVCSTGFCVARCGNELDPDYLFSFVQSPMFVSALTELVKGALYPAVTDKQVFGQCIPWIPLDEQRRIAAHLKVQLAAATEARNAAQAQLKEFRQLKMQTLNKIFASIVGTCPIGEVARVQSGYAFKSQAFQKQGVRLLRNANISPGRVYWDDAVFLLPKDAEAHSSYKLYDGDVLISLDRPIISTGIKVARVTDADLPALLVQRVGRFQINKKRLNPDYLYAFLQTHKFIDSISGHEQSLGVPHISPGQVEEIEIPLPDVEEQKRLAVILTNIAAATHEAQLAAQKQLRDIDLLPARLLTEAFNETEHA